MGNDVVQGIFSTPARPQRADGCLGCIDDLEQHGLSVGSEESLYRLVKDDQPLERLNLRVAGMICQGLQVPLSKI